MQEPTPTIEEFVHSFVPTKWFTPTLENLLYWEIKAAALVVPTATRVALLMRGGMAFSEAAYLATDTLGWYRVVSKTRTAVSVVTSPVLMVAAGAIAAQAYTLSSPPPPEYQGSGEAGWWRSVAQALSGGFGVGTAVKL